MKLKEYPVIYAGALHCIAASGVGRLFLNKVLGEKFDIVGGLGQGDPCPVPIDTLLLDTLKALGVGVYLIILLADFSVCKRE